jgi:DNA-binding response OmpR family regulator
MTMGRDVRILVVEDDEDMRVAVSAELTSVGFQVTPVGDLASAAAALSAQSYACAVFDRMLPDGDAIDYVHRFRVAGGAVPVLFLTARDRNEDVVAGFSSGADDYLVKPFRVAELTARVQNLARRASSGRSTVLRFADVELDSAQRQIRRAGVLLTLSAKEFAVLEYLMLRPDQVVSRTDLIEHCWDELSDPSSNVVDVVVGRLRDKLHQPNVIHAVRGFGYRLGANQ